VPSPAPPRSDANTASALTPPDLATRTQDALDYWRKRLLDLTKRNRALNFKPTKVSTVTIVDEQPVEVYRHLCIDGRPMRFRPTLPSAAKTSNGETDIEEQGATAAAPAVAATPAPLTQSPIAPAASSPPAAGARNIASHDIASRYAASHDADAESDRLIDADDSDAPQPMELDFAPYDPDTLDDRYTDDILQALATPEALDKSLRRLDEQARATIEEQGVNVLFLALGMLHYTEAASSDVVLRAPLVMVPVSLARKSARTGYTIEATDDDAIVNPALAEYLRREYGVKLPELHHAGEHADENGDDDESSSLQGFYQAVMDVVEDRARAGQSGWSVKTDIFLGLFSFQKLVMFKDLEANATTFAGHEMIRQLITREAPPGTVVMGLPEDVREMELDRDFCPEQTAQVVDADSSQVRAIAAISKEYPLVLEGPPGTGKSQTITNMIAQVLAQNKSVFFVAETMAALQVVHRRLVSAGLGEFCLELHASKANKRAVMQELKVRAIRVAC
jgi:hypothetical protein